MPAIDPYRAYNFKLDIGGVAEGHFTGCTGLGVKVEVIKYREAGNAQVVRHVPGPVDYAEVTLTYGLTSSEELWRWMLATLQGKVERRNISIIMLDSEGTREVVRWNLTDAWPSQWRGAVLDALSREIAIESLTLVYDTLERAGSGAPAAGVASAPAAPAPAAPAAGA